MCSSLRAFSSRHRICSISACLIAVGPVWLGPFVLAVAGLQLGVLESSPGHLTLGTSPGALHSSTWSLSTDCLLLVNVSRGVLSLAIEGIGARFRMSPVSSAETVLSLRGQIRCGGHSA